MIRIPSAIIAAGAFALCACGSDNDPGPGGVSVGEARALDEAAEMLDQQRLPAEAVTDADGPGAERPGAERPETEGPETEGPEQAAPASGSE